MVEAGMPMDSESLKERPMNLKHLAVWFSGVAFLGAGATLLFAQPPQPAREAQARVDRTKLRVEVVRLRTEVEMLHASILVICPISCRWAVRAFLSA